MCCGRFTGGMDQGNKSDEEEWQRQEGSDSGNLKNRSVEKSALPFELPLLDPLIWAFRPIRPNNCPFSSSSQHDSWLSRPKKSEIERAPAIDLLVFRDRVMQIQLKCGCGDGQCPEWAIIEFQGVVEVQPPFQDCLQNLEIGKLCRPSSQESYTFTVGYHELTGSKVSLKKPLLVLRKAKLLDPEGRCDADSGTSKVEMQVMGVIRHRILFKTRPKALISRPQPAIREKALGTSLNTKKE